MKKIKILFFNSRKYDFSTAVLIEGLNQMEDQVELRVRNFGSYARADKVLSEQEAIDYGNTQADLLVLGSNHYVDHSSFWKIGSRKAKRVYIDGWDTGNLFLLNTMPVKLLKLDKIFKVNLYQQDNSFKNLCRIMLKRDYSLWSVLRSHCLFPFPRFHSMQNKTRAVDFLENMFCIFLQNRVYPFPFAVEKRCQFEFNQNPKYMLSCMLSTKRVKEREKITDLLQKKNLPDVFIGKIENEEGAFTRMEERSACDPAVPRDERGYAFHNGGYYQQIRNSRACISVPGGGFETFRFWEILGAGSLLISKRVALQVPEPLVENKHYIAFDTIEELNECIRRLYDEPEEMDRIRWEGYQYARKHHTSLSRAQYFIDVVTKMK